MHVTQENAIGACGDGCWLEPTTGPKDIAAIMLEMEVVVFPVNGGIDVSEPGLAQNKIVFLEVVYDWAEGAGVCVAFKGDGSVVRSNGGGAVRKNDGNGGCNRKTGTSGYKNRNRQGQVTGQGRNRSWSK